MKFFASKRTQRLTNFALAAMLVLSTLTASVPFFFSQKANAVASTPVCVNGCNAATLQAELDSAPNDAILSLEGNVTAESQVTIDKPLTLNGNGHTISPTFALPNPKTGKNNAALGIEGTTGVLVSNLIVDGTSGTNLQGIDAFKATATIDGVTLKNNARFGLVVNGSNVTVNNVNTQNNGWGGIDVDISSTSNPAALTVNGVSKHSEAGADIYIDDTTKAVSVHDTNSQYVTQAAVKSAKDLVYKLKPLPTAAPTNLVFNYKDANEVTQTLACGGVINSNKAKVWHTDGSLSLNWAAPAGTVTGYQVQVSGPTGIETHYGGPNEAYSWIHFTQGDGTYTYQVQANSAGGFSTPSAACTINYDSTAPTVAVTYPAQGQFVNTLDTNGILSIKGSITDAHPNYTTVQLVNAQGNSVAITTAYGAFNDGTIATFNTRTLNLPDGLYHLNLMAADALGNVYNVQQSTGYIDFHLDNTKPTAQFTSMTASPTPNAYYNNDFTVGYKVQDTNLSSVYLGLFQKGTNKWIANCDTSNGIVAGVATGNCTVHLPANLSDGAYYVQVGGRDLAGNYAVNAVRDINVQRNVPAQPTGVFAEFQYGPVNVANDSYLKIKAMPGNNNLDLRWNAPSDWVTGYHVLASFPDGTSNVGYGGPNTNAWLINNGFGQHGDGAYTYQVVAVNDNGNSTPSQPFTINYDTHGPAASFVTAPDNNSSINANFHVEATASDNVALNSVGFDVRNSSGWKAGCVTGTFAIAYSTDHKTATLSCDINTNGLTEGGSYYVRVHANDNVGYGSKDVAPLSIRNFVIDRVAPVVTITSPTNGATFGDKSIVKIAGTTNGATSYTLSIGNTGETPLATDSGTSFTSYNWNTANVPTGSYIATLTGTDAAGNSSTSKVVINIDNTGPTVAVNPGNFTTTQPTISGTVGTDTVKVTTAILDQNGNLVENGTAAYVPGATTWSYAVQTALANANYTIFARAYDAFGNFTDSAANIFAVAVPTSTAPTVVSPVTPTITSPAAAAVLGATTQTAADTSGDAAVKGATDNKLATAATNSDANKGTIFGLAWFWWILILAALAAIAWFIIAAIRRRNEEQA